MGRSNEPATFGYTFKNTCNGNTHSKLHVIIHGYIVIVLDVNIYCIYIYVCNNTCNNTCNNHVLLHVIYNVYFHCMYS